MKKVLIGYLLFTTTVKARCQLSPQPVPVVQNQYIEGARLVIDILQLFKKKNTGKKTAPTKGMQPICNFCLFNSDTIQKIKVTLLPKDVLTVDTLILVIQPKEKECSLQIQCGIYNCKIENMENKIISWGDIFINEKEFFISK